MIDERSVTLLAVLATFVVTPGPDTAMTIRSALAGGPRAACFTALGIAVGTTVWVAAAVLGAAAIVQASPLAFTVLQFAGAAYLVYLGLRSVTRAARGSGVRGEMDAATDRGLGDGAAFRQGLLSNALNPKAGPFYFTVLPQFMSPSDPGTRWIAIALVYDAMIVGWLSAYGSVVSRTARAFASASVARALEGITGLVLVALGLALLMERR